MSIDLNKLITEARTSREAGSTRLDNELREVSEEVKKEVKARLKTERVDDKLMAARSYLDEMDGDMREAIVYLKKAEQMDETDRLVMRLQSRGF